MNSHFLVGGLIRSLYPNYLNNPRDFILNPKESVDERSNPSDKKDLFPLKK